MKSVTVLVMVLICVFGLVWIGSGVSDIGSSDIGDDITQEEAEQVYNPVTVIAQLSASALPYIAVLLVIFSALKLYADV